MVKWIKFKIIDPEGIKFLDNKGKRVNSLGLDINGYFLNMFQSTYEQLSMLKIGK